ncbi:MAG: VWA domain-containing protein [bacterium]
MASTTRRAGRVGGGRVLLWVVPIGIGCLLAAISIPRLLGARESARHATSDNLYVALSGEVANELDGALHGGTGTVGVVDSDALREAQRASQATDPSAVPPLPAVQLPFPSTAGNAEAYDSLDENEFVSPRVEPLSTFSIDVDTASYANVRRFLDHGRLPPRGAVRIEELVNYFDYTYPQPTDGRPFALSTEVTSAPWSSAHRLVRLGLRAKSIDRRERAAASLVFLLDVSGSMAPPDKLPLVRDAMKLLVESLDARDRIAIVVYAGASGLALPPTSGAEHREIDRAIDSLAAGGSTNGASGIRLAYQMAKASYVPGGVNRVILATDGDFNVGTTSRDELVALIREEARSGVFLTVLGVGTENLKDSQLEELADEGNGNYAYLDGPSEARKALSEELMGTLVTVAKDVKIQVEWNPEVVEAYRLLGYENRTLAKQDFDDDRKDAGEIGAGHRVTALYEVVPRGFPVGAASVDPLRYPRPLVDANHVGAGEMLDVKLRWKEPDGDTSDEIELPVVDDGRALDSASDDLRFAAAVAGFGMLLRDSTHKGAATFDDLADLAARSVGADRSGRRHELVALMRKAESLRRQLAAAAPATRSARAGAGDLVREQEVVAWVLSKHRDEDNPLNRNQRAYVAKPPQELSPGQVGVVATAPGEITFFQYPHAGAPLRATPIRVR